MREKIIKNDPETDEEYEVQSVSVYPDEWQPWEFECDVVCPYCGKSTWLTSHDNVQTNDEEFTCDNCGRTFTVYGEY